jgi:hypothetical protein
LGDTRARPTLRVMADYESYATWLEHDHGVTNIDPEDLGISRDLVLALQSWADDFDRTLRRSDPLSSGFSSVAESAEFASRGEELSMRLAQEAGDRFTVVYQDPRSK